MNGITIEPSRSVRNLGVYLDSCLTLTDHVSRTIQSCFYQLRQLKHVRRIVDDDTFNSLLHSFVSSRIDYCNSILHGQPAVLLDRMQSVLNAAARLYAGLSRRSHVSEILRELHWLRIPERIVYKLCVIVFRCLHGLSPEYLAEHCVRLSDSDSRTSRHRSAAHGNLLVPRTRTATYGRRTFRVAGPESYNSLPQHLKTGELTLSQFKTHLKTFLFDVSYSL